MSVSRKGLVSFWVLSAGLVVALRILHGTNLGYDLAIQLQAAQNLVHGRGLSIYALDPEADLASPNKLGLLTYFPAGYSLCAAALMAMGIAAPIVVLMLAGLGTILGWWGWGRVAYSFMSRGVERGGPWRWLALAVGLVTPLLFTPRWTGTDIFLWAALPWVLQCLLPGSYPVVVNRTRTDLLAGVLCGFAVLMRYEGLFLAGYCALIILLQSGTKLKELVRRCGTFALGLFSLLSIQIYLNYFASPAATAPGGFSFAVEPMARARVIWVGFLNLTAANFPLVWWLPGKVVLFLTQSGFNAHWLLTLTIAGFVLIPILIAQRTAHRSAASASHDILILGTGLFLAVPLFLWACALGGRFYISVSRYYLPLLPLAVLIAYALSVPRKTGRSIVQRWFSLVCDGYLFGYVCFSLIGVALIVTPGEWGSGKRDQLLGTRHPYHWFSTQPGYMFSQARNYVTDLLKVDPGAILITNRENWFYADPTIDRTRLHRFDSFKSTCVSGPAHILIMAADPFPAPDQNLYWFHSNGQVARFHSFEALPDLYLLCRFPEEQIKVLEAWIPEGTKIDLKQPPKKS